MDAHSMLMVQLVADRVAGQFQDPPETDAAILRRAQLAAQPSPLASRLRTEFTRLTGALATLPSISTRRPAH